MDSETPPTRAVLLIGVVVKPITVADGSESAAYSAQEDALMMSRSVSLLLIRYCAKVGDGRAAQAASAGGHLHHWLVVGGLITSDVCHGCDLPTCRFFRDV